MQKKVFLFDQPGHRIRRNFQGAYQDQQETVLEIYNDDLLKLELEVQRVLLKPQCKDVCNDLATNFSIHDGIKILSMLSVFATVPSPRGDLVGLTPPNKAPRPQIEI